MMRVLVFLVGWLVCCPPAIAGDVRIVDGDTLALHGVRVRLAGIDAPETGTACGACEACGPTATAAPADLVGGGPVVCAPIGVDRYGRLVARCRAGGVDLATAMVAAGWARDWPAYSGGAYAAAEAAARAAGRGIWGGC